MTANASERDPSPAPAAPTSGGARTNLQLTEEKVLEAMQVQDDAAIKKPVDRRKELAEKRALTAKMREAARKDYKKLYYAIRKRSLMQERETQYQQLTAEREARAEAAKNTSQLDEAVQRAAGEDDAAGGPSKLPMLLGLAAAGAAYAFTAIARNR